MQRLALAIVFALLAVAVAGAAVASARSAWGSLDGVVRGGRRGGELMQKLSFFLLIALILYVSVLGSA
jgi:hypothetical protein